MRTPQAPRRRGDDEAFHGRCPQKDATMRLAESLPHPHRRRRHLRPREDESASRVLPSTTCPTETNNRTELSGNKKRSPLRTSKTQRRTYEKYKEPHADNSRQPCASAPPAPKTSSSVTISFLLSTSHILSSLAFCTAGVSATSV